MAGVLSGIEDLGRFALQIPADLAGCENMQDDLDKLNQWASIFNNPQEVAELVAINALKNFRGISNDVVNVVHDWHSDEYLDLGTALANTLLDATAAPSSVVIKEGFKMENAVEVVAGMLDGII